MVCALYKNIVHKHAQTNFHPSKKIKYKNKSEIRYILLRYSKRHYPIHITMARIHKEHVKYLKLSDITKIDLSALTTHLLRFIPNIVDLMTPVKRSALTITKQNIVQATRTKRKDDMSTSIA